jgi:hypothetical protein
MPQWLRVGSQLVQRWPGVTLLHPAVDRYTGLRAQMTPSSPPGRDSLCCLGVFPAKVQRTPLLVCSPVSFVLPPSVATPTRLMGGGRLRAGVVRCSMAPPLGDPRCARMWLSCGQAAKRIGVSPATVKRGCKQGRLRYERSANGYYRILVSEYEQLVSVIRAERL